ncbi:MAG TPA: DUF4249 domain-containing protein [Mucilaginibacter sp.]|nr:DUF4249 domain-containing protein [Mucilaginibacter sp.]
MKRTNYIAVLLLMFIACRKPYDPPVITSNTSYLVVEGEINPGQDSTVITLSHTVSLSSNITVNPVAGAIVTVVSDQNTSYPLIETSTGNYTSSGLNLDNTHAYRLAIKTSDGKQYQSDLEPVLITPPIDSVGFNIISSAAKTGIQLFVNAHDATNQVKYFRWDFNEEWLFYTKYTSNYISNGTAIVPRQPNQNVTYCYTGEQSSDINLASSAKLSQDIIYQNPLVFIPSTSEKIEDKYSILVHQYALTPEAFNFYTNLKKNTEQLGSIFDAEPSSSPGNIHCISNPAEQVIGYVSVSTVSQKRVYILKDQLPQWVPVYPYACYQDTTGKLSGVYISDLINNPQAYYPTIGIGAPVPYRYLFTSPECADCTIRGTVTPPPYWK